MATLTATQADPTKTEFIFPESMPNIAVPELKATWPFDKLSTQNFGQWEAYYEEVKKECTNDINNYRFQNKIEYYLQFVVLAISIVAGAILGFSGGYIALGVVALITTVAQAALFAHRLDLKKKLRKCHAQADVADLHKALLSQGIVSWIKQRCSDKLEAYVTPKEMNDLVWQFGRDFLLGKQQQQLNQNSAAAPVVVV